MFHANNLLCSLLGIIYPILCSLYLFNETPTPNIKLNNLNKYWILFSIFVLLESLFGLVLQIIT